MEDTFKEYGIDFQTKSIAAMLNDKVFLSKIADVINPLYYDNETHQYFVKEITKYFLDYKIQPTKDVIAYKIGNLDNETLKRSCKISFVEIIKQQVSSDQEFIKNSVVGFCRNQAIKNTIIKSVDWIKEGKYDKIMSELKVSMNIGIDSNVGHDYVDDIDDRYTEEVRNPVDTPWEIINEVTKGGFGIGDLAVIMGLPASGKSWWLCALGAHALLSGKNVIHYTLELSDYYVGRRYDCILSGISIDDLDEQLPVVKEKIKDIKNKLIIKRYFPRSISTLGLRAHIDKCINLGHKPDLILVDYADLMGMPGGGEFRHKIEHLYEDLKCIGGEYECPVITVSQLNRTGIGEDYIDSDIAAAEAFSKNNTPDFIMTFTRPERMREMNGTLAFITKNRYGPDKVKLIGPMDTSTGKIDIYSVNSKEAVDFMRNVPTEEERMRSIARTTYVNSSSTNGDFLQNRLTTRKNTVTNLG